MPRELAKAREHVPAASGGGPRGVAVAAITKPCTTRKTPSPTPPSGSCHLRTKTPPPLPPTLHNTRSVTTERERRSPKSGERQSPTQAGKFDNSSRQIRSPGSSSPTEERRPVQNRHGRSMSASVCPIPQLASSANAGPVRPLAGPPGKRGEATQPRSKSATGPCIDSPIRVGVEAREPRKLDSRRGPVQMRNSFTQTELDEAGDLETSAVDEQLCAMDPRSSGQPSLPDSPSATTEPLPSPPLAQDGVHTASEWLAQVSCHALLAVSQHWFPCLRRFNPHYSPSAWSPSLRWRCDPRWRSSLIMRRSAAISPSPHLGWGMKRPRRHLRRPCETDHAQSAHGTLPRCPRKILRWRAPPCLRLASARNPSCAPPLSANTPRRSRTANAMARTTRCKMAHGRRPCLLALIYHVLRVAEIPSLFFVEAHLIWPAELSGPFSLPVRGRPVY